MPKQSINLNSNVTGITASTVGTPTISIGTNNTWTISPVLPKAGQTLTIACSGTTSSTVWGAGGGGGGGSISMWSDPRFVLHDSNGNKMLIISTDGHIEWNGPLNQNAVKFINSVKGTLDLVVAGENALERTYKNAIKKCLKMAKSMDREQYIAMLEEELQTRTSKLVLRSLKENDEECE